jgi:hypothetical protein
MSKATNYMTPMALQRAGMDALVKELGAVDAIRFIHLYDSGHGDYTKERHEIFDNMSVDDIMAEINKQ